MLWLIFFCVLCMLVAGSSVVCCLETLVKMMLYVECECDVNPSSLTCSLSHLVHCNMR